MEKGSEGGRSGKSNERERERETDAREGRKEYANNRLWNEVIEKKWVKGNAEKCMRECKRKL